MNRVQLQKDNDPETPQAGSQTSVAVGFKDNLVDVLLCLGHHKKLWHEAAVLRKDISISLVFVDQCFRMLLSEMFSFQLGHWHFS